MSKATFDKYSGSYEEALHRGISVSGEDSTFSPAVVCCIWQACSPERAPVFAARCSTFGCGVGDSLPLIGELLRPHT